jgi:hypothetical protein
MTPISSPVTRTSREQKSRKRYFKHREMMKNAGELLKQFELSEIQKPICPTDIKDFDFVASYNWSNSDVPMIFVPGIPSFISLRKKCLNSVLTIHSRMPSKVEPS